jgi:hypothetical protein
MCHAICERSFLVMEVFYFGLRIKMKAKNELEAMAGLSRAVPHALLS